MSMFLNSQVSQGSQLSNISTNQEAISSRLAANSDLAIMAHEQNVTTGTVSPSVAENLNLNETMTSSQK